MSQASAPVEAENRAAFLVQLKALLAQVSVAVSHQTSSASSAPKLKVIRSELEVWIAEMGEVEASPRPTIVASPPAPPLVADAAEREGEGEGDEHPKECDVPMTPSTTHEALSSRTPDAPSFGEDVVDETTFHTRTLLDLVHYVDLLFSGNLSEGGRLRAIAKGAARLLMVRLFSILNAALQHVIYGTYTIPWDVAQDGESSTTEHATCDDVERMAQRQRTFLRIARNIRISTLSLVQCIKLVVDHAPLTDPNSTRFAFLFCADALRQLGRVMSHFQHSLETEELAILRSTAATTTADTDEAALCGATRASQEVQGRLQELQNMWGPSLWRSIVSIGSAAAPAVTFFVSVASLRDSGAVPEMAAFKTDARRELYTVADAVCGRRSKSSTSTVATDEERGTVDATTVTESRAPSNSAGVTPAHRAAVASLRQGIGVSFAAEFITAVAGCCGEVHGGQAIATRVVAKCLQSLAERKSPLLSSLLTVRRWRRPLLDGLLNCLVSPQVTVLQVGLECLHVLLTTCSAHLGPEIGYLYSSCLFQMLESDHSPPRTKKVILQHLVSTFLGSPDAPDGIPMLLQLYRLYDLNPHAHQLNLVQQFITVLSKVVRCAPASDFGAAPLPVADRPRRSSEMEYSAGTISGTSRGASELPTHSVPLMALQILVQTVEVLSERMPSEGDVSLETPLVIPPLLYRDRKVEEQRLADVFNTAPQKAIARLFGVTDEEMNPPGSEDMRAHNWERRHLPEPVAADIADKVHRVARFLRVTESLRADCVAEYLTIPAVFPLQVCDAYMAALPLAGLNVVEALATLFEAVELPREGQRIERMLEFFCGAYFAANDIPGVDRSVFPFATVDACFIVVVAVVMLNTDLHNATVATHMQMETFVTQLGKCNDGNDFAGAYLRDLYAAVQCQPFSRKATAAAGKSATPPTAAAAAAAPAEGSRVFDGFFVSSDERRQITFTLELQRLAKETRGLLRHRVGAEAAVEVGSDPIWWWAVARDLLLSAWSALCAVFGPTIPSASAAQEEALRRCVRGLTALLCVTTAFSLMTECEVTLLALLRMCDKGEVRDTCRRAILVVSSTVYSINFSTPCWVVVVKLLVTLRKEGTLLSEVETLLARIESYTQCVGEVKEPVIAAGMPAAVTMRHLLDGMIAVLHEVSDGPGSTFSSVLYYLRRVLGYSLVTHMECRTHVGNYLYIHGFHSIVLPQLVHLVEVRRDSNECLQALMEFVVHILGTLWTSYPAHSSTVAAPSDEVSLTATTSSTIPAEFVGCFSFFRNCYTRVGRCTLVAMHILQGVKELVARTLHTVDMRSTKWQHSPFTLPPLLAVWSRVLFPLVGALSTHDGASPEVCSLAVLILRKLVALCCGAGTTVPSMLPHQVKISILVLLAHVCFIGGMCADIDNAQACLAQLSTICTAALVLDDHTAPSTQSHMETTMAPDTPLSEFSSEGVLKALANSIEHNPDLLAQHTLERLSLMIRCAWDQTRAEVLESLRTLSPQLQPSHTRYLALKLCDVVVEGCLEHATAGQKATYDVPDAVTSSFHLFNVVPEAVRRCSPAAFRQTLPAALGLMTGELLAALPITEVSAMTELLLERCLLPVALSPHVPSFQVRSLLVRSLAQCAAHCHTRCARHGAAGAFPLRFVMNSVGMILLFTRIPIHMIVPRQAPFIGMEWVNAAAHDVSVQSYCEEGRAALHALAESGARVVMEGRRHSSASLTAAVNGNASSSRHYDANKDTEHSGATRVSAAAGWAWSDGGEEVVSDGQLIEYCTLLAQVLSGLPKLLASARLPAPGDKTTTDDGEALWWRPPRVAPGVLQTLLLEAAGTLFAILWRVCRPHEMEQLVAKALHKSREGNDGPSNAVLPHAAVRGALNSYLSIALLNEGSSSKHLLDVAVKLLRGTAEVQVAAQRASGIPSKGRSQEDEAELAIMQRLRPQEQQHIRTCRVGMYQELSVVIAHWITGYTQCAVHPSLSPARVAEVELAALDGRFFNAAAQLLTPTAGPLIHTLREYFLWYSLKSGMATGDNVDTLKPESTPLLGCDVCATPCDEVVGDPMINNASAANGSAVCGASNEGSRSQLHVKSTSTAGGGRRGSV